MRGIDDALRRERSGTTVVVNHGVDGNRVRDLIHRWDVDCIAVDADVVSILIGVNDTRRRYDQNDPTSVEEFAAGYEFILGRLRASGDAKIVLMEPFIVAFTDEQRSWREDLEPKIDVVQKLASEFGARLVRTDERLNAAGAIVGAEKIAYDSIHPTPRGHDLLSQYWRAAVLGSE